ncbi:MAG TPA: GntR family transcriptional regulator [Falsiroseomonas sp.]|jgi:DNA-binding GntR family transcriptional regulator|nr:GntR family transcriptional regulator [Falsiroseomonas sp.]
MAQLAASTPAYAILRDRLRGEILSGGWVPGTHRTLGAIATTHGVSISPVREALLSLAGEGLVQMREHRGAVVPVLDAKLFDNLYDLRGALQALLARRAAERATEAQIAKMARHEQAYAEAAERGDAAAALEANEAFHDALEDAAENPQATALYKSRSAFVNAVRLRLGFGVDRMAEAAAQHRAILAAISARDAEKAAFASFNHSMSAKKDLLQRL